MNFTVRKATEEDFPSVLSLIKELAEFERAPEKVTNTVDLMKREKDSFHCFVAEAEGNEMAGMALYYFAYYTWVGRSLYLEDLIVKENYRGQNIGSALMKKIFDVAAEENCKRIRWQVLDWNNSAIEIYKKWGAEISSEWLNCTIELEGIERRKDKGESRKAK